MNVAILFDDVGSRPSGTPDEWGVLEAVGAVEQALRRLGHTPNLVPAGKDPKAWTQNLEEAQPHVVFNLCEGLGGESEGEVLAARVIEEMGLPFTGSSSSTLALARRKDQVNLLLEKQGFPIPPWALWDGEDPVEWSRRWTRFPAIVKPAAEDGSVGITQDSVVKNAEDIARRLESPPTRGPLLVQAFVGTREINAAIVGGEVLALSEIAFTDLPEGHHPMVDYAAKWFPGSPEDRGTRRVCPAPLVGAVVSRIQLLALKAWRAVGGTGYGRVDFRLDPPDNVFLLEVNPNPDLSPSAGLAHSAKTAGLSYESIIGRILSRALLARKEPT